MLVSVYLGEQRIFLFHFNDPIPVKKALSDGCERLLIVLTRPQGYVKECTASEIFTLTSSGIGDSH